MTEANQLPNQTNLTVQPEAMNGLAIMSLILGIISLFFSWTIFLAFIPVIGAVLGHLALTRMTGRNIAIAGLVLNYIALFIPVLVILLAIVVHFPHGFWAHHPFLQHRFIQ